MHYQKSCFVLFGIIINSFQIHGLEIKLPLKKVGIFEETTHINCSETGFDFTKGYIWYKDNSAIYDSATGDATGKYTSSHGTDYFTLEITNTSLNDNGVYRCNYNFLDDSDTLSIQAKGTAKAKEEDDKLQITVTNFYPNTTTVSSVKCNGKTITGSSTISANGDFYNLVWISVSVDTNDLKDGCDIKMLSLLNYTLHVIVDVIRCPPICKILAILCAVFGVLGMMEKIGIFVIMIKKWLTRNVLLGIGVAGIGLFITSIGFGAAVLADDDCHEKCPDWVIKLPTAFVVISSLGIVFDIIIAILLLVGVIPAGKNEEGGPDGPDGGHNGGGALMTHARVHAGHEETHRGSLSNRDDSDSAVSRQDVHVQENQGHLSGRPMPAIPTHQGQDKKGRGLSANFDDDHPMVSISVPEKKAGDLGPLHEEPQKKKKKKKKRTDEE